MGNTYSTNSTNPGNNKGSWFNFTNFFNKENANQSDASTSSINYSVGKDSVVKNNLVGKSELGSQSNLEPNYKNGFGNNSSEGVAPKNVQGGSRRRPKRTNPNKKTKNSTKKHRKSFKSFFPPIF